MVRLTIGAWLIGGALLLALMADAERREGWLPSELPAAAALTERPGIEDPRHPDHELILTVIREHRRTAEEAWREHLAKAILRESTEASVDPLLVASIVAKESSFSSRAVSRAGAVGLMQLRPFVARDVAERTEQEWRGVETLHSPELNVRLGILYYKELMERFEGDPHKALTAYNYGPTRVSKQLRSGTFRGSRYARNILGMYASLTSLRTSA